MEKLVLGEQDIVNAVCVYVSRKKQIEPEEVEVELMCDDRKHFSAEVFWNDRKQVLIMSDLIEALRIWLEEFLGEDPFAGIKLELDDDKGIIARIG